jgi:phosphate transport system protein
MPRTDFDRDLNLLQDDLMFMGSMVDKALVRSLDALKNRDTTLSQRVIEEDDLIDAKRFEIEDKCIDLIATQQPLAGDLRHLITVLHVSVELERMGDYAEGIAKIGLSIGDEPLLKPLIDIPRMGELAGGMLRRSLDSLVNRDVTSALEVITSDDEVDQIYEQIYRELLMFMIEDPGTVKRATYLLWVSHDLERIADRATNIAERAIYLVTGTMPEEESSRY